MEWQHGRGAPSDEDLKVFSNLMHHLIVAVLRDDANPLRGLKFLVRQRKKVKTEAPMTKPKATATAAAALGLGLAPGVAGAGAGGRNSSALPVIKSTAAR